MEKKIFQEVDNQVISLKHRIKFHETNPVLKQDAVIECLYELHEKYVLVPIGKAANNISKICKKYYATVVLKVFGILDAGSETYGKINKNREEIIQDNLEYSTRLKLSNGSKGKSLPIMSWISKLHKNPEGSRFIIASKKTVQRSLCRKQFPMYLNLLTPK